MLFKKKSSAKKPVAPQLKEYTFSQAPGYKGFKKCHLVVYGKAPFPKRKPSLDDKPIVFKQKKNWDEYCWEVYLGTKQIGALYEKAAEPFNEDNVDAVYLRYDEEIVNDDKHFRPHLYIHYKETKE